MADNNGTALPHETDSDISKTVFVEFIYLSSELWGSSKFGDHRHCGSGAIMFLVAEEQNSKCSRFNLPLLFNPPLLLISKGHGLKTHGTSYY